MVKLHSTSLSPDPTYAHKTYKLPGNRVGLDLFPHALVSCRPTGAEIKSWGRRLDMFRPHPALRLRPDAAGRAEILFDFGTELDGALNLEIDVAAPANAMISFGESALETEGLIFSHHPDQEVHWHLSKVGRNSKVYEPRGFRYLRLAFADLRDPVALRCVRVQAQFTFQQRDGDFQCSDGRFQRVWQTSAYTARLCTREDTLWDGIKRDRIGWYGDARITKLATDNVFFDPRPAEEMLSNVPTNRWANRIPNYSFDAMAMLKQHIYSYGLARPCVGEAYRRLKALLAWAWRTQTDGQGFIKLTAHGYFAKIGFIDWSLMPIGGRFQELCWLQAKYVEGLRNMAEIARLLKDDRGARRFAAEAERLSALIVKRFWREGSGFVHTLNRTKPDGNPYAAGYANHYQQTYVKKLRLGPSGPSRQANATAVWAGLASDWMRAIMLSEVFDNPRVPPVITAYFLFYEQMARAMCGDRMGALLRMRDYVGTMLENEDAATVWELYDPAVADLRKYSSHRDMNCDWPTSLCHGWGAGAVPMATELLLGVRPTSPGYRTVSFDPMRQLPWAFSARVPTPHGPIVVEREKSNGPIYCALPKGIKKSVGSFAARDIPWRGC